MLSISTIRVDKMVKECQKGEASGGAKPASGISIKEKCRTNKH